MAKFRTTGSCPAAPNGCGSILDKVWTTNTPENVPTHVRTACPKCSTQFMATNTPIEEVAEPKVNKEVVETITKPLSLVIEYTQTTTHYTGDNLPSIVVKPTGRVRRTGQADGRRENWFELPKKTIEEIQ